MGLKKFVEKIYECAKAAEPHFPSTETTVSELLKDTTGGLYGQSIGHTMCISSILLVMTQTNIELRTWLLMLA